MTVEKSDDKSYPYTIKDSRGDKIYCSLEDLKDIKKQVNRILKRRKRINKINYNDIKKRAKQKWSF